MCESANYILLNFLLSLITHPSQRNLNPYQDVLPSNFNVHPVWSRSVHTIIYRNVIQHIYIHMHIMFWFVMLYYIILQRAMLAYYIIIQLVSFTFFILYHIVLVFYLFIYIYIYTAYILNLCVKSCQPSQDRSWRTLSCQRGRR